MGFGGPIGLRYEALYPLLDRMTDDRDEWEQLLDDIQVLESAALTAMRDQDE